jgi:hypothetical protein
MTRFWWKMLGVASLWPSNGARSHDAQGHGHPASVQRYSSLWRPLEDLFPQAIGMHNCTQIENLVVIAEISFQRASWVHPSAQRGFTHCRIGWKLFIKDKSILYHQADISLLVLILTNPNLWFKCHIKKKYKFYKTRSLLTILSKNYRFKPSFHKTTDFKSIWLHNYKFSHFL